MQAQESHVQYLIYTHVEKRKRFFPPVKNSRAKKRKSHLHSRTKGWGAGRRVESVAARRTLSLLWLRAAFLNQPWTWIFLQLQLSGTKKKADNRKRITMLMLQVIGAKRRIFTIMYTVSNIHNTGLQRSAPIFLHVFTHQAAAVSASCVIITRESENWAFTEI